MAEKALSSDADAIFLDLEDSVAPDEKSSARQLAIEILRGLDISQKTVSLRVNSLDTAWTYRDVIDVLESVGGRLDTIILPKVGSASDLYALDVLVVQVAAAGGFAPPPLEAIIETAAGITNLASIAAYNRDVGQPRLEALHFGAGDYAASIGARTVDIGGLHPDYPGDNMHGALSAIVAAARANGLIPMDSAFADFKDEAGYLASAKRAAALGFAGKWAIHPSQIALANDVFSPSDDEVSMARGMVSALDAAAAAGKGAAVYHGKMIDMASNRMARSVLALHDAIIRTKRNK